MKKIQLSAFGKEFLVVKFTTASMLYFWEFLLNLSYIRKQKLFYFTQVFKFLGRYLFIVIAYNLLYFCGISCNLSSFISDFIYLGPLSFFLDECGLRFVNLVYLSKELSPTFTDLLGFFLVFLSFIFALIFIISFFLFILEKEHKFKRKPRSLPIPSSV